MGFAAIQDAPAFHSGRREAEEVSLTVVPAVPIPSGAGPLHKTGARGQPTFVVVGDPVRCVGRGPAIQGCSGGGPQEAEAAAPWPGVSNAGHRRLLEFARRSTMPCHCRRRCAHRPGGPPMWYATRYSLLATASSY